jgi:predicted ferric reductase
MNVFLRGSAWLGLYAGLVLLPGAVAIGVDPFDTPRPSAVEVSVALGFLAFPLVMIQFALVSHLHASSRPFGTDAMVQFHQYIGLIGLAFVIAHPLLLNVAGLSWTAWNPVGGTMATRSGAVATALIALIAATTICRRRLGLNYEWWQRLHLALAVGAAGTIVVHVLAVGGYGRATLIRYLVLVYAGVCGSITINYRLLRPLRLQHRPWEITDNRDEGANTRTLRVRPVDHDGFDFEPGQFAWMITGSTAWSAQQHPLSISSSAERARDGAVEFSIKALGDWSSHTVPRLASGTRVWIDGPFGVFTIDRKYGQGFVFVAGGIGIAPFRSMLLTMHDRGDRRHVVLFYAAHDQTRTIFAHELEALRGTLNLDIVYVFEAPDANWAGERGQVTVDVLRRHLPSQFRRYGYFVCGPPPMMTAVEGMLAALGVSSGSIDTERFNVV